MQHSLEHSMPVISSQERDKVEDEVLQLEEKMVGVSLQVAEVVSEIQQHYREKRPRRRNLQAMWRFSLMLGDGVLLITLLAGVLVLSSYLHLELRVSYDSGIWNTKLIWGFLALVLWSVASKLTQAYEPLNIADRFRSMLHVLFALTFVLLFWMVLTSPLFIEDVISYAKIVLFFFIIAIPILTIWRMIFAEFMSLPRFRPRTVIVGTAAAGKVIARELRGSKRPYATILGYISENTDAQVAEDGIRILGGRNVLRHLGQSGMIDMIITAVDYHVYPELFREAIEMAQLGISVVPMSIAYENMTGKIPVEHVGDQWYLALPLKVVLSPLYLCWRKVLDVVFGLLGTAVLLLILPILAVLIYLDSPGPIFYHQDRLGLQGKLFRIYKFRSMHTNAEKAGHAAWAAVSDPRVTRFGRFMRATHLDELPQVLNILRGEMSLIGPRPEREEFAIELEKTVPFFRCRLMVKPGLTGWAQVGYRYCSTDVDALVKLQYDLYYIKRQSFMFDILIILKTVIEVIFHRGV